MKSCGRHQSLKAREAQCLLRPDARILRILDIPHRYVETLLTFHR